MNWALNNLMTLILAGYSIAASAHVSSVQFSLEQILGKENKVFSVHGISDVAGEKAIDNGEVDYQAYTLTRVTDGLAEIMPGSLVLNFNVTGFKADNCLAKDNCVALQAEKGVKDQQWTFRWGGVWSLELHGLPCRKARECRVEIKSWEANLISMRTLGQSAGIPTVGAVADTQHGIFILDAVTKSPWLQIPGSKLVSSLGALSGALFEREGLLRLSFQRGVMLLDFLSDRVFIIDASGVRYADKAVANPGLAEFQVVALRNAQDGGPGRADLRGVAIDNRREEAIAVYESGDYVSFALAKVAQTDVKTFASRFAGITKIRGRIFVATHNYNNLAAVWEWVEGGLSMVSQYNLGDVEYGNVVFSDGFFYELKKGLSLMTPFTQEAKAMTTSLSSVGKGSVKVSNGVLLLTTESEAQSALGDDEQEVAAKLCKVQVMSNLFFHKLAHQRRVALTLPNRASWGQSVVSYGDSIDCGVAATASRYSDENSFQTIVTSVDEAGNVQVSIYFKANANPES